MNHAPLPVLQVTEIMSRLSFFEGLDSQCLRRLATGTRQRVAEREECVLRGGELVQALHVVVSGQVRVVLNTPGSGEKIVDLIGRGEGFGEAALILDEPCPTQAVANSDCHLLAIDAVVVRREIQQDCRLHQRLLRAVSRRHLKVMRDMEMCLHRQGVQRVACYLLRQQPSSDSLCYWVDLPARKRDVASQLGMTQETFSRALQQLSREGIVLVEGRRLEVIDSVRLAALNLTATLRKVCEIDRNQIKLTTSLSRVGHVL